jgi:GNAT superfamily N-acetyltransferase
MPGKNGAMDTASPAPGERLLPAHARLDFALATLDDAERLVALRIEAMRDSLERIGRFDPQRARERFLSGFEPERTWHVLHGDERIGFYVLKPRDGEWWLDHLYLRPAWQGKGIGAAVLARVFAEVDAIGASLSVGALRGSDANRFYARHGFAPVSTDEFDIYYRRAAPVPAAAP